MKKVFVICFITLILSAVTFGNFLYLSIKERIESNNLIVIGELENVTETETREFRISKGTIVIDKIIYGRFVNSFQQKLKPGDKVKVEWRNSKMIACQFSFSENEKEIWFLKVEDKGKIVNLSPNTSSSLSELAEVKKHLKNKEGKDTNAKNIKTQKDFVKTDSSSLSKISNENVTKQVLIPKTKNEGDSSFFALLVALASIYLYFVLYRSRFKIR